MKAFFGRTKWFFVFLGGVILLLVILWVMGFTHLEFLFSLFGIGVGLIIGHTLGYGQAVEERDKFDKERGVKRYENENA